MHAAGSLLLLNLKAICHLLRKFLLQCSQQEVLELLVAHVAAGAAGAADAAAPLRLLQAHAYQLGLAACHVELHHQLAEQLHAVLG